MDLETILGEMGFEIGVGIGVGGTGLGLEMGV